MGEQQDRAMRKQNRNSNDDFIEDGVGQDVDQEDFLLGNGEAEEVDGDFVGRGVQNRGHIGMWRHAQGMPYILYQLELSALLSDCFLMSFQSGALFHSSQEMRGLPCQDTTNWTLELELSVYHRM